MMICAAQNLTKREFNPYLILELIHIQMYHFVQHDHLRDQLVFFLRFIIKLMETRADWKYGNVIENFQTG